MPMAYKRVLNSFLNYESLAKKKDIDYNFYSELQDEDVLFDGTYLDLIINNLLSNAFKYTEEGERIYDLERLISRISYKPRIQEI